LGQRWVELQVEANGILRGLNESLNRSAQAGPQGVDGYYFV
jgi:hypothetical protein